MTRVASAADSVTTRERARKTAAAAEAAEVAEAAVDVAAEVDVVEVSDP